MNPYSRIVTMTIVGFALAGCGQPPAPPPKPVAVEAVRTTAQESTPTTTAKSTSTATAAAEPTASATPGIEQLRATLAAAKDEDARVRAVDAVAAVGQNARGALDDLIKAAGDESPRVRWHAARALGLIGEDAVTAVPLLVNLLADSDPIVATQAAAAIGLIRSDDEIRADTPASDRAVYDAAGVALIGQLTHPDPRVRRSVLRALKRLQPAPGTYLPLVAQHLADADPSVILPALQSLADLGGEAVPFLMEALKNPRSRYWASVALAEIGPAAAPAVPLLRDGIASGSAEERMQSIMALAAIGDPALPAADDIAVGLQAPEGTVRFASAFALGRLKARSADAALEKAAADEDPFLAAVAAWARARIHPDDTSLVNAAVERLSAGLASPKQGVQSASISALSDLSGSIDDVTEKRLAGEFIRLLSSPAVEVREAAAAALVRAGAVAVEPLESALGEPAVRGSVLEILAAIGPLSKDALDSLVKALDDPDPRYRGEAAVAIAAVGPAAAEAVPRLEKILGAEDAPAGLRYSAAYALGRIGPAARSAFATLRGLASSNDEILATVATWAALKIEPENTGLFGEAVPILRRALKASNDLARLEAAVALGDIGVAAAEVIPLLELVAEEDPLPAVRAAATRALEQIRPGSAGTQN